MDNFDTVYKQIIQEQTDNLVNIGIFPGAFKPPHIGHYTTAYNACMNNDKVFIFISEKSRALSTQNKGNEQPDSVRYSNIIKSDKYTNNLFGVQTAEVARMTSASAFRAAIAVKDKNTVAKNIPDGVDKDRIYQILLNSNDISSETYGHITVQQSLEIWNLYKQNLTQLTGLGDDDIIIKSSVPSPVKDTYDLVSELNDREDANTINVRLYVGE